MAILKVEPLTTARALRGPFDYRRPDSMAGLGVGSVVRVPFGPRRVLGVVVALAEASQLPPERLAEPIEMQVEPANGAAVHAHRREVSVVEKRKTAKIVDRRGAAVELDAIWNRVARRRAVLNWNGRHRTGAFWGIFPIPRGCIADVRLDALVYRNSTRTCWIPRQGRCGYRGIGTARSGAFAKVLGGPFREADAAGLFFPGIA